jgi:hypothetical protein
MTAEEIRKIVDDERTEQLTAQVCRHWQVAADRLEGLVQELAEGMDTFVEAELYAAIVRLQSVITALLELNRMPCTFLFSEYIERISQTVSNPRMRQSVMTLAGRLLSDESLPERTSFFDLLEQMMAQQMALPAEKQEAIKKQASPIGRLLSLCAQYMDPNDLMMLTPIMQSANAESGDSDKEETDNYLKSIRSAMDCIASTMSEGLQGMVILLIVLMMIPEVAVNLFQKNRNNSKVMASLFNKVLTRARKSDGWEHYWKERRDTLRVVNDSSSWQDVMTAERSKERQILGQMPCGLFAKWTTDSEAFDEDFLEAHLSDEQIRYFVFHLAALCEIARELDPTTRFGNEQLVYNDVQRVGEAVMDAANKLTNLLDDRWLPHYINMWKDLIEDENIFAHLMVTRKSPHNNLFTARFFCHLVGEMKKSAVFGAHSDRDLALKLTDKQYVDTFRKNIQEGMSDDDDDLKNIFRAIYQKYNQLAHSEHNCTIS